MLHQCQTDRDMLGNPLSPPSRTLKDQEFGQRQVPPHCRSLCVPSDGLCYNQSWEKSMQYDLPHVMDAACLQPVYHHKAHIAACKDSNVKACGQAWP